jgi:tetratricopeptide (TPR) repeat protein
MAELDRPEEAIAVYKEILARFGDSPEPALREEVAKALVNKGVTLGQLDRSKEAIAVYEEVLARFGDASEPPLREVVANAIDALTSLRSAP